MRESAQVFEVGSSVLSNGRNETRRFSDAIVILPHAGGDPNPFRAIAKHILNAQVIGAIYPGRLTEDAPGMMDIFGVAKAFADFFEWDKFERVTIFGHSMGGLVAHALCGELESRNYRPHRVVISSAIPPAANKRGDLLPTESDGILRHIIALGGTPDELLKSAWFHDTYLPMIAADYRAVNKYAECTPPVVKSPLEVFTADQDLSISATAIERWSEYTTGPTSLTTFVGGHFYLFDDPACVATHLDPNPHLTKESHVDEHLRQ